VAVANHDETANTFVKLIPGIAVHTGLAVAGVVCFGIGARLKGKAVPPAGQPIA
jgi:hypothetical protein